MSVSIRICLLAMITSAREINFPSFVGLGTIQHSISNMDGIDISTGSELSALTTFANLPYTNCFADDWSTDKEDDYDIAIMGAPFDTVSSFQEPTPDPDPLAIAIHWSYC